MFVEKDDLDMKQVKFEVLVKDIESKLDFRVVLSMRDMFGSMVCLKNPLFLIFDNKRANSYRKSILKERIIINIPEWDRKYSNSDFNDPKIKITATKDFINECRQSEYRKEALKFVFWALFATAVEKIDFDEKISLVSDLAYLLGVDDMALLDIIQIIKVVCGEEEENFKFQTREIPNVFGGVLSLFNTVGYGTQSDLLKEIDQEFE